MFVSRALPTGLWYEEGIKSGVAVTLTCASSSVNKVKVWTSEIGGGVQWGGETRCGNSETCFGSSEGF